MHTTKEERERWLGASALIDQIPIVARLCRDVEELLDADALAQVTIAKAAETNRLTDENRSLRNTIAALHHEVEASREQLRSLLRYMEGIVR